MQKDKSGLIQVDSTKFWTDARDTFVRPEHCEQIVFKSDPKDPRWLYVVQVAPRSKPICEGLEEQIDEGEQLDVANEAVVVDDNEVDEEEEAVQELEQVVDNEVDEEEQAVQELEEPEHPNEEEGPPNDEDTNHAEEKFNDDDAEMYLEIDVFGTLDLEEDDRIDDFL